jgi:hypothetical protein
MSRLSEIASGQTGPNLTVTVTIIVALTMLILAMPLSLLQDQSFFLTYNIRVIVPYSKPFPYMGIQASLR